MAITYNQSRVHWNYFLAIEKDFEILTRFIEPCDDNNQTYSLELAKIIMTSTQEIDCILKELCKTLDPESKTKDINDYRLTIREKLPDLIQEVVFLPKYGMESQPWKSWMNAVGNPIWWKANNNIKHNRLNKFHEATLQNAYNAIGALLITVNYFYKTQIEKSEGFKKTWKEATSTLIPNSTLFQLNEDYYSRPIIMIKAY